MKFYEYVDVHVMRRKKHTPDLNFLKKSERHFQLGGSALTLAFIPDLIIMMMMIMKPLDVSRG